MKQFSKIKSVLMLLFIGSLVILTSCKDSDDDKITGFDVNESEMIFTENGGLQTFKITTGYAWSAQSNADWLMVSPATGVGSAECEVKVDSSYLYSERKAQILIETENGAKMIEINQFGFEKAIRIEEPSVSIPHYKRLDEAFFEVNISSNVAYEIIISDEDQEWLTLDGDITTYDPTTATPRKQTYKFKYGVHSNFRQSRKGNIEFRQTGVAEPISSIVEVEQNAAPKIVPSRAGDSLALLAIQSQLQVYGGGWESSRPMTHWDDINLESIDYVYYDEDLGISKDTTEMRVTGARFFFFFTEVSLPVEVKYLTEIETLIFQGNANRSRHTIDLGSEVTELKNLKSLAINGYGIKSLPKEMIEMDNLEELSIYANNFLEFPLDIITKMKNLTYFDFSNQRITEGITSLADIPAGYDPDNIGLRGTIPVELFNMPKIEYLYLSHCYLEGELPTLPVGSHPQLRRFTANGNRLTGDIPEWILQHERLACWDPYVLLFTQEGMDSQGNLAGFSNEPGRLPNPDCPDDEEDTKSYIMRSSGNDFKNDDKLPLTGNWGEYKIQFKK